MKKQSDLCEAQSSLQQSNGKAIKDRALRKKQKLNSKRYEIGTKMWEIEMKEIASKCENGLHSSQDFLNCKNEITGMHKNIEKLREERDSWINACKQEGILSDEDLKEFARGINELLSGRNDLETTIKYLDIELEKLLGPNSNKKELGTERLRCQIDKELKFEIKELTMDIKGFKADCENAANSNKDMASKRLRSENGSLNSGTMPPNLKDSCMNRLQNENRRYQTVNLQLEDEVERKKLLIQVIRCLKKGIVQEHLDEDISWGEFPQLALGSLTRILEENCVAADMATVITETLLGPPSSGTRSNGSIHLQQRNISLPDLHPADDDESEVSLADMDYYDRGDEQEIEFMGHSILKGLESIATNLRDTIPELFPQKKIKVTPYMRQIQNKTFTLLCAAVLQIEKLTLPELSVETFQRWYKVIGNAEGLRFNVDRLKSGVDRVAIKYCDYVNGGQYYYADDLSRAQDKVNKANEELATIKKNISIGPLINWIPKC